MLCNFFMLISTEHEISTAHKAEMPKTKTFLDFKLSDVVFIVLINVKRATQFCPPYEAKI